MGGTAAKLAGDPPARVAVARAVAGSDLGVCCGDGLRLLLDGARARPGGAGIHVAAADRRVRAGRRAGGAGGGLPAPALALNCIHLFPNHEKDIVA